MAASINVYRTFYHQYPWPYSECGVLEDNSLVIDLPDRSIFDIVVHYNYSYTRKGCLSICTQVKTSELCGCNTRRIGYQVPNIQACSIVDELICAVNVWSSVESLNEFCSSKCPFECSQSLFKIDINYAEQSIVKTDFGFLIDNSYWCPYYIVYFNSYHNNCETNFIFSSIDTTYFFLVIVQFSIKYDSLSYINLDEEPKLSGEELLGIIGGHLGLFLGMSLLSFVELVELFSLVCTKRTRPEQNETDLPSSSTRSTQFTRPISERLLVSKKTKEYMDRLNIVALPNLFRARHTLISIIWLALFICSIGICMFLVVNSVLEYTSFAVSTSVFYKSNEQIDYPTVTL